MSEPRSGTSTESPPAPVARYRARFDRGDGADLRRLRFSDEVATVEVASRLYFAARDEHWRTIAVEVVHRDLRETPEGFALDVTVRSTWPTHPFEARLHYLAVGDELIAEFDGVALGAFRALRIGLCVLHPAATHAGRPATITSDGRRVAAEFPHRLVMRLPHDDREWPLLGLPFERLEIELDGADVDWRFDRDPFELEDQRNWSDASFKTYSAPRGRPQPFAVAAGDRLAHRIRVRVRPTASGQHPRRVPLRIAIGDAVGTLPPVRLYRGPVAHGALRPEGGFPHLNTREPRAVGAAAIELGVNGSVHAADDDSVLESTTMHGQLVAEAAGHHPGAPVLLAPIDFADAAGDWLSPDGEHLAAPAAPPADPRRRSGFGAAWVVASAASAAPAGVAGLHYLDASLDGTPAAAAVAELAGLEGRPLHRVEAAAPLAAIAVATEAGIRIGVANTGPDPVAFTLPDGAGARLGGFGTGWWTVPPPPSG